MVRVFIGHVPNSVMGVARQELFLGYFKLLFTSTSVDNRVVGRITRNVNCHNFVEKQTKFCEGHHEWHLTVHLTQDNYYA